MTTVLRVGGSKTINTILLRQLELMRAEGFQISCVCDDDHWAEGIVSSGFPIIPLGLGRRPGLLRGVTWAWRMERLLRSRHVDVVHTHNAFHGIFGRAAARKARVPIIVQTVHNWWYLRPELSSRAKFFLRLERAASRFTDCTYFINSEDWSYAIENGIVPEDRALLIGNGIDTDGYLTRLSQSDPAETRNLLGIAPNVYVVSMVARVEHPKDHRTLLLAFKRFREQQKESVLLIVGDGMELGHLRRFASEQGLSDAVMFLGHRMDVPAILKASNLKVFSTLHEGFGRCLVEAMMAKVPIVASDVTGVRDVIRSDVDGILVPAKDPERLAAGMLRLSGDKDMARTFVERAFVRAQTRLDESLPARSIADSYRELVSRKGI